MSAPPGPPRLTLGLEDGRLVVVDARHAVDCTLPVAFEGPQPGAYHLPAARETPVRMGSFVGSVAHGGPVDCMELTLFPHGNGTHTECAGHIRHDHQTVADLHLGLRPAVLASVTPVPLGESGEDYAGTSAPDDLVVTRRALVNALFDATGTDTADLAFDQVLLLRTVAPDAVDAHRTRSHSGRNPPYLTHEATVFLCTHGVRHLVTDLPSIDREKDGGTTPNHRLFFGVSAPGPDERVALLRTGATLTELAAFPVELLDGRVVVEIAVAPIASDAAPSRVVVYPNALVVQPDRAPEST